MNLCLRPDARGHLFYRVRIYRGRKGERRSMSDADYAELIAAAHQQLSTTAWKVATTGT